MLGGYRISDGGGDGGGSGDTGECEGSKNAAGMVTSTVASVGKSLLLIDVGSTEYNIEQCLPWRNSTCICLSASYGYRHGV